MADIRTAVIEGVASGIAARYSRDPLTERLIEGEVNSQEDARIKDLRVSLSETRTYYEAERERLLDQDGVDSTSKVIKDLEEERDVVMDVLNTRLKKYKRS